MKCIKEKIKFPVVLKIEYRYEVNSSLPGYRYIYYRIKPSELSLWKRLFYNPWRPVYHAFKCLNGYCYMFNAEEFNKEIRPLKNLGEIYNYLSKEKRKIDERGKSYNINIYGEWSESDFKNR